MPILESIAPPANAAFRLRILAEECQLTVDLWLAAGRKTLLGAASSEDCARARHRMDEAVEAYHALLQAAPSGTDETGV